MSTRTSLTAALAAALLAFLSFVLPAVAAGPTTLSAKQLNDAFRSYGDTSGLWNGADGTASVKLPDGRVVWLFSDTFIGAIDDDGGRPAGQPMVHNSMVVQQDGALATTLIGGTADEPLSLVGSASDVDPGDAGHWVGDATVEGNTLQVIYNHYQRTGDGPLDVRLIGTALASFDLPSLTLRTLTRLPLSNRIAWGSAILEDGETTYVYGAGMADDLGSIKPVYLAKVARGNISGAWQFWTGDSWSTREGDAAALMSGVGTAFGVQKIRSEYVLVTVDGNRAFNPDVVAYRAPSATGPFTGPVPLLRAPEPQPDRQIIVYDVRLHPEWAAAGKLLVSYNVNSLDANDNSADARLYRPRFVDVAWPPPSPDGLPPAPAEITAATNTQGGVQLKWNAVAGASGYRIHQRDVAAGQTHFMRLAPTIAETSYDATKLTDGHLYEFSVSAVNAVGEGARGATVSVVARTKPAQPGEFRKAPPGNAVTGEYLVELKDNAANGEGGIAAIAERLVAKYGGRLENVYATALRGFSVTGMTDAQARALAREPAVASVEESRSARVFASDPGTQQDAWWGLDRIDGTVDGKYVYPSTGQGARIYVVDTGIRTTHDEFGGRAAAFSNDWHDPGDNTCKEHGTFVAGVAAGSTYGAAKKASVFDVQAGCSGKLWSTASVVSAVNNIARNGQPGSVVNMSLGFATTGPEDSIEAAVRQPISKGFTVVAAAGNGYWADACGDVPARIPEAITVASIGSGDFLARTSNIGKCVDLFAPGEDIKSAGHGSDTEVGTDSGTSIAAPHVAGAAAMILAAHPNYSPADVHDALAGLAETGNVKGPIGDSPNRLLHVDAPLPIAPTKLTATAATDGTITLKWQPVAAKGVHYLVSQRDVTAEQAWFRWTNPIRTGTTATATDLEPGHVYELTVAAANEMAVSPESNVAQCEGDDAATARADRSHCDCKERRRHHPELESARSGLVVLDVPARRDAGANRGRLHSPAAADHNLLHDGRRLPRG